MNEMLSTCLPAMQRGCLITQGGEERPALSQNKVTGQAVAPNRTWRKPVTPHLITPR